MEDIVQESGCFEAVVDVLAATNWYAVGLATIATFFLDFLLYSFVWSDLWFHAAMPERYRRYKKGGVSRQIVEQEMGANMPRALLVGLLATGVYAFALFHLQYALGVASVEEAAQLALFLAFFLVAPQYVGQVIWEDPSCTLMAISVTDQILSAVVTSTIVFHLSA
mmetsp:Transcript_17566/g.68135  ORF Transcript_17566/g.68135 Transcript_17566/m.68135 type:complete len:166 (-) Transcript_17566:45-542(-)|eukprot:CAMPEP_0114615574 /NCGR_PEP_ID=MMETSP0168-20121206/6234_1 /TAXON_ID=95228 ORGANISM="Vannella sp., Strain DIVA3 517/6/12" /NCGR_SAMPLE_ID=MMETSP0168 /ASSEMBLY_ACC=CAM_ASM_000044 /LENGTH=165 /DNA_ID=CAMNT_0001826647 /DNA_START=93 /DNA_END=590 /DNA_ORIENTATION=-